MALDTGTVAAGAIDEAYEFSAPRFFDFITEETEEAVRAAESWFEAARSHAPSPFNPRIKESRAEAKVAVLCDFAEAEEPAPEAVPVEVAAGSVSVHGADAIDGAQCPEAISESPPASHPAQEEKDKSPQSFEFLSATDLSVKSDGGAASTPKMQTRPPSPSTKIAPPISTCDSSSVNTGARTPKTQANMCRAATMAASTNAKGSVIKGGCDLVGTGKAATAGAEIAQANQAVKRQKLDDGRARQILNVKTKVLPHKRRTDLAVSNEVRRSREDMCSLKEATTYVSTAELVKKFESGTRKLSITHSRSRSRDDAALQGRPKLVLTRPKEPEFQTSQRIRAVKVKSSAEIEEEMLAKIPKFRARPFNKKIAEAPSFPPLPRKPPQISEFSEFHLKTMERASRYADTCSEVSCADTIRVEFNVSILQSRNKPLKSTQRKPPQLHTANRARPPSVKSSQELELEELEKAPKFRAKPLNKKILESKGDIGVFVHPKSQVTAPKEFRFCTDVRLGPPSVADLFDKLSLHSECSSNSNRQGVPRCTIPNPFSLQTEERGQLKERQLEAQLLQKKVEEEKARVPPKPEPKPCTRPEGFQLESLVRHELEQQRLMEERQRMEREEAQRRIVKAQPVLKEDPIPLPEKERKPLTEVQQFVLHVDERAVHRSEFDSMIKEKEKTYKRLREENEFAQKIEEEKALKQLRRTMVPHARQVPKFDKPFRPQKSTKQVTRPKSPQLQVDERGARRHALIR
ncbi:Protein TPX2 [Zea mays]|uniref:Protein TPX2 n=1 Tax=Zea mays TaxID=4577 RepID=A0A1D6ICI3_MAIZE|nr:Protein TPX2 [Zea mays]